MFNTDRTKSLWNNKST